MHCTTTHALYRHSCIVPPLMHCTATHALYQHSCIVPALMHCTSTHALYRHSCIVPPLMHGTTTHALYRHSCIVPPLMHCTATHCTTTQALYHRMCVLHKYRAQHSRVYATVYMYNVYHKVACTSATIPPSTCPLPQPLPHTCLPPAPPCAHSCPIWPSAVCFHAGAGRGSSAPGTASSGLGGRGGGHELRAPLYQVCECVCGGS